MNKRTHKPNSVKNKSFISVGHPLKENVQKQIKCITFDFGGVITEGDIIEEVLGKYSMLYFKDVRKFWKEAHDSEHWSNYFKGKITEAEFWARSKQDFGNPDFDEIYFGDLVRDVSSGINPKMMSLVSRLKSMGYKTAILTNNGREWFEPFKPLLKEFDPIITSYELRVKKPDEIIYQIMLEEADVKAEECVFIDDFACNTEAAQKLGIHTITFKTFEQAKTELEGLLDKKLE